MTDLNIFDQFGKIRSDLDTERAAIEALPDAKRETLFACIKAVNARDEADARKIAAVADAREKQHTYNNAVMAYDQTPILRDPLTGAEIVNGPRAEPAINSAVKQAERVAAMKAVSAAQRKGYVPAKPVDNKLKTAVETASAALTEARAELIEANAEFRAAELRCGETIIEWRACLDAVTRDDLMKQHVTKGQADRMARVARGESPEPPRVVPEYLSELDRVRGAGKIKPRPLMR